MWLCISACTSTGVHTPTLVLVNMSERTVFTKGLKWVWGSNDSGEWPQGLTGCWGMCHFFPDSLSDEQRHKETLLHTHTHTQPFTHIYSLHRSVLHSHKDGCLAELWVDELRGSICLSLSPPPRLCFGLELQHVNVDYIKHSLEPYISLFHSAPRAEQELVCHCS